jgi:hypothetical protein
VRKVQRAGFRFTLGQICRCAASETSIRSPCRAGPPLFDATGHPAAGARVLSRLNDFAWPMITLKPLSFRFSCLPSDAVADDRDETSFLRTFRPRERIPCG